MDIKLVVAEGKLAGQEIPINKSEFYVGKSKQCHLRPGGSQVGDKHCVILCREGYAGIKDFGSPSGTFVNDERVDGERALKNGDKLRIGSLIFDVQLTVDVSGQKMPKVRSISEAATRATQKAQSPKPDEEIDLFAIFDEEVPSEDDFINRKKQGDSDQQRQSEEEGSALDKEKKMQESTRNAAADTIKAILNQTR